MKSGLSNPILIAFFAFVIVVGLVFLFLNKGTEVGPELLYWLLNPKETVRIRINEGRFVVDVAKTGSAIKKGLIGRQSIGATGGTLFEFKESARHTLSTDGLLFAVDIIWIYGDQIVWIERNAVPPESVPAGTSFISTTYTPAAAADKILEVRAGTADRYEFRVGDNVYIIR